MLDNNSENTEGVMARSELGSLLEAVAMTGALAVAVVVVVVVVVMIVVLLADGIVRGSSSLFCASRLSNLSAITSCSSTIFEVGFL